MNIKKEDRSKNDVLPTSPSASKQQKGQLLNLDEALKLLQTTRSTLYRWINQGLIRGIKAGRQWRFEKTEIERFLRGDAPEIEVGGHIKQALAALEGMLASRAGTSPTKASGEEADPLGGLVYRMISIGVELGASDIHLEAQPTECRLRYRVDGALIDAPALHKSLVQPLSDRWKTMFKGNVQEHQRPQDGRLLVEVGGTPVDLRVGIIPSLYGESLVARILDKQTTALNLSLDRVPAPHRDLLRQAIDSSHGLILFSGPAGCGKSTLAYAALQHRNCPAVKILTVEDPVEYALAGTVQVPVQTAIGRTFPHVLRALMRQDPDILYVGEASGDETAQLCVQAALTGHLVLTTLPTKSACASLKRLQDMGVAPYAAADAVRLTVCQRLVRSLCPDCRRMEPLTPTDRMRLYRLAEGLPQTPLPETLPHATGCPACKQLGFRGRQLLMELLPMTPAIASALAGNVGLEELQQVAVADGIPPLAADGLRLLREGATTLDEVCGALAMPQIV